MLTSCKRYNRVNKCSTKAHIVHMFKYSHSSFSIFITVLQTFRVPVRAALCILWMSTAIFSFSKLSFRRFKSRFFGTAPSAPIVITGVENL